MFQKRKLLPKKYKKTFCGDGLCQTHFHEVKKANAFIVRLVSGSDEYIPVEYCAHCGLLRAKLEKEPTL